MYIGVIEVKSMDGNLLPGMIVKGDCLWKSKGGKHTYLRDNYKVGDKFDHLRGSNAYYQIKPESLLKVDIGEHIPSSYRKEFKDSLKPINDEEFEQREVEARKSEFIKRANAINTMLDSKYKESHDDILADNTIISNSNGMWAQFKRESGLGKPRYKLSWVADVILLFFAVYGFIKFLIDVLP